MSQSQMRINPADLLPELPVGTPSLVVTRHPGAVEWLRRQLPPSVTGGDWIYSPPSDPGIGRMAWFEAHGLAGDCQVIPVMADVTPDDVHARVVWGNLPLHLAKEAKEVVAIEFAGAPPRGAEYSANDMEKAGARLARYRVTAL